MVPENSIDKKSLLARKDLHQLVAIATKELNENKMDDGSWGLALMEANGNTQEAKGLYIKHRVQILKDQNLLDAIQKEEQRVEARRIELAKLKREQLSELERFENEQRQEAQRLEEIEKEKELKRLEIKRKTGFDDPTLAINKLKKEFNVRLAQDLIPQLGITYVHNSSKTQYKFSGSDVEFSNLQDALIGYICVYGYKKTK